MIPWETIDSARVPGSKETVTLRKRGEEFSIRTIETELMNSRIHGSEEVLAEKVCHKIGDRTGLNILIGGLGMGFTLAAAIEHAPPNSRITVSELIPAVIQWNKDHLGHLAGHPLNHPNVIIKQEDVAETIGQTEAQWDAILLDVDNGPDGLTRKSNDRLYTHHGLNTAFKALKADGILAVWSSGPDPAFTARLKKCRFKPQTMAVRARKSGKGSTHTIWMAQKPYNADNNGLKYHE